MLVMPDPKGKYRSFTLANFWLDVGWLWLDPLPTIEEVLLEVAGDAYARRFVQSLQRHGYLPSDR